MSAKGDQSEFAAFLRRILRAAARRYAAADPDDLLELVALSREVDEALTNAVRGLRSSGFSWTEIALPLGITRQAARQRWADKVELSASEGSPDPATEGRTAC